MHLCRNSEYEDTAEIITLQAGHNTSLVLVTHTSIVLLHHSTILSVTFKEEISQYLTTSYCAPVHNDTKGVKHFNCCKIIKVEKIVQI